MPSINDVFNELTQVNSRLITLHNDLTALKTSTNNVKSAVDQVDNTLSTGFANLSNLMQNMIVQQNATNQALLHITKQNDTVICILENISKHTCALLNEADMQTTLQRSIENSAAVLRELAKSGNPEAALELERHEQLHEEILKCCPPEPEEPPCKYEPCKAPRSFRLPKDQRRGPD